MIRRAGTTDIKIIQKTLDYYATQGLLLPRSLNDLYDHLRDFVVYEENQQIVGVSSLHVCWDDLGEIRSLAVLPPATRQGLGRRLVEECEADARRLGLQRVFTLTYQETFFSRLGYRVIDKSELPHKVWRDCLNCVKFPDCDEIAMIRNLS